MQLVLKVTIVNMLGIRSSAQQNKKVSYPDMAQLAAQTCLDIQNAKSIDSFIRKRQSKTYQAPLPSTHPAAALLHTYEKNGFPASTGPSWPHQAILDGIAQGPHASTLNPTTTEFFRQELSDRVHPGFSVILSQKDALHYFNQKLKISRLAAIDQPNRKPRLICNSTAEPNGTTGSVNETTDTSDNPGAM